MKKLSGISALAILVAVCASGAHAATLTDSYSDWLANAGGAVGSTTQLGVEGDSVSTVNLNGGGSFTATPAGTIYTVGSGWATWSGGYTGQVIYSNGSTSVSLALSGLKSFGFEVEPVDFFVYNVTVTLSSGATLTDAVSGDGGAQFFGYYGGGISAVTITSDDPSGFGYGNFSSVSAVPLPASAPMFGAALLALGAVGYSMKRRKADATA